MRIGYSFWGFLGPGITDTPDGGRSHRRVLIDALAARGHDIVFLQTNRDLHEAGHDLRDRYQWDAGLPDLDALFLEWRWPIAGRNATACASPGHTCDLHRQAQMVEHYVQREGLPTLLWDKDRQLPAADPLRATGNVTVCEAALHPDGGARTLLFPVADETLDAADPHQLAARDKDLPLVYVGNQYDRDHAFDEFFAVPARTHRHAVAGKWTRTDTWPHVTFLGRVPFDQGMALHSRALTTVLLLPDRYAAVGQMTQRLPEAVLAGCLPLTPQTTRSADAFTPLDLHVRDGRHATDVLDQLTHAGAERRADLLTDCLDRLDQFRVSRQVDVIEQILTAARPDSTP